MHYSLSNKQRWDA